MGLFSWQRRKGGRDGHANVEVSEKAGVRYLHLGSPAIQSAMRIRDPWALELEYTRAMMAFLLFNEAPRDAAILGLGAGSLAKFIHRNLPDTRLTALEINPEVIAAARGYFSLPPDDERLQVVAGDGAAFVRERPEAVDVLLVDAYDAKRIVEALASPAFYADCLAHLRPGGVAAFNLWGTDEHFPTYFERIGEAFAGRVLMLPAEKKSNIIVFAFKPPLPESRFAALAEHARRLETRFGLEFPGLLDRMREFNPKDATGFALPPR